MCPDVHPVLWSLWGVIWATDIEYMFISGYRIYITIQDIMYIYLYITYIFHNHEPIVVYIWLYPHASEKTGVLLFYKT